MPEVNDARRMVCLGVVLLWLALPAGAHHGRDFLLTRTAHLPQQGDVYFIARQDLVDADDEQEIEFEPAVIAAAADWLLLEAHAHIEKIEGASAAYESIAALAQVRFTPREAAFALGSSLEYEFVRGGEEDVWEFAGIASYSANRWLMGMNVLAARAAGGGTTEWGYAAGVRRSIAEKFAVGLEVNGSLEDENQGELLMGIFIDPSPSFSVNMGLGTGFNGGPDYSIRSSVIFHLL